MGEVWKLGHDSNNWSEYSTQQPSGGWVSLSASAAMGGTSFGIEYDPDGTDTQNGIKAFTGSAVTTDIRLGFRINLNDVSIGSSQHCVFLTIGNDFTNTPLNFSIQNTGSGEFVRVEADNGVTIMTLDTTVLGTGENTIEVVIVRETNSSSADGSGQIYLNGSLADSASSLQNFEDFDDADGWADESCALNLVRNPTTTFSGTFFLDEIVLRDDTTPIFSSTTFFWHHNGTSWTDIGDSGWTDPVNGIAVKKGDDFDTILASVGTNLDLTTNQGTSYATRDTYSFTPATIAPLSGASGLDVVAYNGATGGVRVEKTVNAESGTVSTENLTSDHSTTGSGTDVSGVA